MIGHTLGHYHVVEKIGEGGMGVHTSNVKWFSGLGELRVDWGPGYRVYLARDGDSLVLLFCGGTKKRQQADIAKALALHEEYKMRKKAAARTVPPEARRKR